MSMSMVVVVEVDTRRCIAAGSRLEVRVVYPCTSIEIERSA